MTEKNSYEWRQFIRLGDMMGDGLHHEPDGAWITKEYRRLSRILVPGVREAEKDRRKIKRDRTNEQMKKLLNKFSCIKCGGALKQSRSGSKVAYCTMCNQRHSATTKKR